MSESKANEAIREEKIARINEVSRKIKDVLETSGMALQPFLSYSEFGIQANVRLVEVPKPETNDERTDSNNDDGAPAEAGTSSAE